jgi:hypothetical protein
MIREPDSTPSNLRDFLVQHPRIIERAFGEWEGTLTYVSAGSFNQYPTAVGTYEVTITAGRNRNFLVLILTSPRASLLSDSQADQVGSFLQELINASQEEEAQRKVKGGGKTRTVIVSGRRQELSESETAQIGEFNTDVRALNISLRTYDLLIDACVSVDQQDWKR